MESEEKHAANSSKNINRIPIKSKHQIRTEIMNGIPTNGTHSMNQLEATWIEPRRVGLDCIGLGWIGLCLNGWMAWFGLDWVGLVRSDWVGLDWVGLSGLGWYWLGMDWIWLDWGGLGWIGMAPSTYASIFSERNAL